MWTRGGHPVVRVVRLVAGIGVGLSALAAACGGSPALPSAVAAQQPGAQNAVSTQNTAIAAPNSVSAPAKASVSLTSGTVQLYPGDPGSADLVGDGFEVSSAASGGWPSSAAPGSPVDFSTTIGLSNWGPALVEGVQIHGDPAGPGAGRVWISGTLKVTGTPSDAPTTAGFSGSLHTIVTVAGTLSGFFNADVGQEPLFTVNVRGTGTMSGQYRLITSGTGPLYLDQCCASIAIGVQ
jgi:hypothetical protein